MLSLLRIKDRLFYGWVVLATLLIVGTTVFGIRQSYGIFFKSIESEFNLTRAETSLVSSAHMVIGAVSAVLVGWALDRYGPRVVVFSMGLLAGLSLLLTSQTNSLGQIFITYSLLLTIGISAMYLVVISTASRWFDKKRGLALGIATSGTGLGMAVVAPLATFLISDFGWRIAYLTLGLIVWLIVIPLSSLLKKNPHEIGALPDGAKPQPKDKKNGEDSIQLNDLSLPQAFRTRNFWIFMTLFLLFGAVHLLIITHLVPHITDMGFSVVEAATVLSVLGVATLPSRVIMGIVSDKVGRKLTAIILSLFQAGAMVWLISAQELWMFYLFAVVYGFSYAGRGPIIGSLVGDTFGLSKIGTIMGVTEIGWGIGAAIGPAMGGAIFDVSGSYSMAFVGGAVIVLLITLLTALIKQKQV